MPLRRRLSKKRPAYPEAIERLLRGEPLEETEENRYHVLTAAFFHEYPELGLEIERAALQLLDEWREQRERKA
jgi:hypothetical protein